MTDKPIPLEIALAATEREARSFFTEYATGEGYISRRWNVLREALSPAKPDQGWRVRKTFEGGTTYEPHPDEDLACANSRGARDVTFIPAAPRGEEKKPRLRSPIGVSPRGLNDSLDTVRLILPD
jgi:hypothetical protein